MDIIRRIIRALTGQTESVPQWRVNAVTGQAWRNAPNQTAIEGKVRRR